MFYSITGKVTHTDGALVVLETGGVGYAVHTSYLSARSVAMGQQATVYTYLHVREDLFELYGFCTQAELRCFKQLIGISGVGPKAALGILGAVTPDKLALCVLSGDEKALCAAPGIGKKLAQRIILELKDKLGKDQFESAAGQGIVMPEADGGTPYDDALAALLVLGYPRAAAMSALKGVSLDGLGTDEIVRIALKKLF